MKETHIIFRDIGKVECETVDVEKRELKEDEIRIEPSYYGICGSDLHVLAGRHPFARPPVVPGHEVAATVVEVGSKVASVKPGDHVTVDPIMACMHCEACREGRFNLCEPPRVAGFRAPGLGRSSSVIPARNAHKAPQSLPMDVLVFAEPLSCAYHCVHRLPERCLKSVLVIGAGTIGLSIIQSLHIIGCRNIAVIEPDGHKRRLAEKYGAAETFDVGRIPDDRKYNGVIDVVASQSTITLSFDHLKAGGTVVCMGVPSSSCTVPLPRMNRFECDLLGSGMYVPGDIDGAVSWLAEGKFDTSDLISKIFPVEQAREAYDLARQPESIKVVIKFKD
jgi:L-gulonate 5-dehydrogenase